MSYLIPISIFLVLSAPNSTETSFLANIFNSSTLFLQKDSRKLSFHHNYPLVDEEGDSITSGNIRRQ